MTFNELLQEVYNITNRPDREAETKSAIKSATLKAHRSDFYSKDIHETGVEFASEDFRQSLDYISLISNFRTFKYLRRVEDENDDVGAFFDIISVDETLDSYGVNKTDIAYVAGRVLEIRSKVEFSKMLLGAYVLPVIREEAYTSWIADLFPFAIIYEAARIVFKAIGQIEESNAQKELVSEEYVILQTSSILDIGY